MNNNSLTVLAAVATISLAVSALAPFVRPEKAQVLPAPQVVQAPAQASQPSIIVVPGGSSAQPIVLPSSGGPQVSVLPVIGGQQQSYDQRFGAGVIEFGNDVSSTNGNFNGFVTSSNNGFVSASTLLFGLNAGTSASSTRTAATSTWSFNGGTSASCIILRSSTGTATYCQGLGSSFVCSINPCQ